MTKHEELRIEINKIDASLVELFEDRMKICKEIAAYKSKKNIKIFDKVREQEVVKNNVNRLSCHEFDAHAEKFFKELMKISRKIQKEHIQSI
ncbi:chorismate mutase [Phocicoccus pinnipedialis]|uniref:Chorismate mutase domain-containing protein n=1 Tax=Phocicoccus pinnipedialis TaxID=110845 RepID=A0A6V7R5U8_9BACL|nr:chorismate mutase [Jeotgalicoccus pinnipedialis]MBP1939796.1 monofunctional chorismate mutase [Jeotgalicoccus pinnipedialis]CAD2072424.1 hypothetical protein JEOPIN946_00517 [Jeotgalicoccus pinnipedialis]